MAGFLPFCQEFLSTFRPSSKLQRKGFQSRCGNRREKDGSLPNHHLCEGDPASHLKPYKPHKRAHKQKTFMKDVHLPTCPQKTHLGNLL